MEQLLTNVDTHFYAAIADVNQAWTTLDGDVKTMLLVLPIALVLMNIASNLAIGGRLSTTLFKIKNPVINSLVIEHDAKSIELVENDSSEQYIISNHKEETKTINVEYLNKRKTKFRLIEVEK